MSQFPLQFFGYYRCCKAGRLQILGFFITVMKSEGGDVHRRWDGSFSVEHRCIDFVYRMYSMACTHKQYEFHGLRDEPLRPCSFVDAVIHDRDDIRTMCKTPHARHKIVDMLQVPVRLVVLCT